jgi:DNA-binding transcriptional LysR family regulator
MGTSSSSAESAVSIRQLRAFLILAEELHFGRAAARLHVTQPALSQQIARLEAIVGVRLLERDRSTVGLTPAGQRFRSDARVIVQSTMRAIERARLTAASPEPVTVCHALTLEWSLLPKLMDSVAGETSLDVVWVIRSGEAIAGELKSGTCDVVLGRYLEDDVEGVEQEVLMWEQPAAYVGHDDPLAQRRSIRLSELAGHTVRLFRREAAPKHYDQWSADLAGAGVELDASVGYRFGTQVLEEISRGEYVTLGQASARLSGHKVSVVPVTSGLFPLPIALARRRADDRLQVQRFVDLVRALTSDRGPLVGSSWRVDSATAAPL